eukprot:jgi/Mesen1/4487/ME000228S03448
MSLHKVSVMSRWLAAAALCLLQYLSCLCVIQAAIPVPRVEDMTLAEKVGQMAQVDKNVIGDGEVLNTYMLGAVVSGGGAVPAAGNTPGDWADMIDGFQRQANRTRLRIPVLYGLDAIHGHGNLHGATMFPHHIGLGATRNPALVRAIGAASAREVAATGVRWTFAPAVSLCLDPRWGRCYESFGEDTDLVTALAAEITGWQSKPTDKADLASGLPGEVLVAATAKHFLGDGGTTGGKDEGNTNCTLDELRRVHLPPFRAAVALGVGSVMISYHTWNGIKMHGNRALITGVLRDELGFDGVIVSDWQAVERMGFGGDYPTQLRVVVNAGLDLLMLPRNYEQFTRTLVSEVEAGRVPMARIDDAVRRILALKQSLGLFEDPYTQRSLARLVGSPEHRQLARQAVRESLVLLKNRRRSGGASMFPLPLQKGKRVLVGGTHAHNIGFQCGGWTIGWQGGWGNTTPGTSILEGIRAAAGEDAAEVVYSPLPTGGEQADYAVLAFGEKPYAEHIGDSYEMNPTLELPQDAITSVQAVCTKMPCVLVLIHGRPLDIRAILPHVDALVAAWLPGTEGAGIADALFGEADFTGRLPVSWFHSLDQLPLKKGAANYNPMFPFGFGLSKAGHNLTNLKLFRLRRSEALRANL